MRRCRRQPFPFEVFDSFLSVLVDSEIYGDKISNSFGRKQKKRDTLKFKIEILWLTQPLFQQHFIKLAPIYYSK